MLGAPSAGRAWSRRSTTGTLWRNGVSRKGCEILKRGGASGRGGAAEVPASVADLGQALRRAREARNLALADAAERTGLPVGQLEALEGGAVEWIPDHVHVLVTLRRYADFLGLPGERFVLVLVDNWPLSARPPRVPVLGTSQVPPVTTAVPSPGTTAVLPAVASARPAGLVDRTDPPSGPSPSPAGEVRFTGGPSPTGLMQATRDPVTAQVPVTIADTGLTPAVRSSEDGNGRSPLGLRVLIGIVIFALAVGVAGLIVHRVRPQWLRDIGIARQSTTSSTATRAGGAPAPRAAPSPVLRVASVGPSNATLDVRAPSFVLRIVPSGGPSWVQATDSQHPSPIFAGTLAPGQGQSFVVTQPITIQLGAASARLFVAAGGKLVGYYVPPAAPFTVTLQSVR